MHASETGSVESVSLSVTPVEQPFNSPSSTEGSENYSWVFKEMRCTIVRKSSVLK